MAWAICMKCAWCMLSYLHVSEQGSLRVWSLPAGRICLLHPPSGPGMALLERDSAFSEEEIMDGRTDHSNV